MPRDTSEREDHLRKLADMLLFAVEKRGDRFTLRRTADVSSPVVHEGLSIEAAEDILNVWKLRGPHGG